MLEQRPLLWIEMLFWKTPEDADEMTLGMIEPICAGREERGRREEEGNRAEQL